MNEAVENRPPHVPWVSRDGIEMMRTDMTVIVGADVKLRDLQSELAEANQWLPIDGDENLTIAELVEDNSTGPLRLGYGAWRDLLLGTQFTNGKCELITAGGKTVKNVAGYDLTKFMIGQRGIFGKIVTITSRTYRRPDGAIMARFPYSPQLVNELIASPLKPQWMLLSGNNLDCGYLAESAALEFYHAKLEARKPTGLIRRTLEEDTAHRTRIWKYKEDGTHGWKRFRAGIPPTRIMEFVKAAEVTDYVADAAFGVVLGTCPPNAIDRLRATAKASGGSIYFPSLGPETVGYDETTKQILRELKKAFDPEGKLAPLQF